MGTDRLITSRSARLKRELREGKVLYGAGLTLSDPACAEIFASIDFDFVLIDFEHTVLDLQSLHGLLMGLNGTGSVPLVRVPSHDPDFVKRVLDLGVGGIVFPMVNSKEEAAAAVAACKYPPEGIRGLGPRRASHYYRLVREYCQVANDSLITITLIEHEMGARNIEEILAVPGIDAVMIGSGDLASSMGFLGHEEERDVQKMVDRVFSACRKAAMPIFIDAPQDEGEAQRLRNQGALLLFTGVDTLFLASAAAGAMQKAKQLMLGD